ncbi:MAG: HDOD domain-containing protein [Rhodocyclaceae bacterium]|nr:HDOD domain-containing protein [Rhodocyclaceae bacterium]
MTRITHPLDSLDAYVNTFSSEPLPVLRRTVLELATMRENEESVAGKQIAAVVLGDPLMTMRLLSYTSQNRGRRQNHDITTIDRAVMMIGITPFFRIFDAMPTLEDRLADLPKALVGVLRVIARARRAAHYARDWAILRHDLNVEEITVAALLHDAADILCWAFAPALTERVYGLQRADRNLRTASVQREVFNFSANEIQLAVAEAWDLPQLLITLMHSTQSANPRMRTVELATTLARHTARGWDNPAIPDDITAISELLHINRHQLVRHLAIPEEHAERLLPEEDAPPA